MAGRVSPGFSRNHDTKNRIPWSRDVAVQKGLGVETWIEICDRVCRATL